MSLGIKEVIMLNTGALTAWLIGIQAGDLARAWYERRKISGYLRQITRLGTTSPASTAVGSCLRY